MANDEKASMDKGRLFISDSSDSSCDRDWRIGAFCVRSMNYRTTANNGYFQLRACGGILKR